MSSNYTIKDPASPMGYIQIPKEDYIKALLSIAQKNGIEITDQMIKKELVIKSKKSESQETDVWDEKKRKKLLEALERTKGLWADDKDFEKRQEEREKIEIETIKELKKAW